MAAYGLKLCNRLFNMIFNCKYLHTFYEFYEIIY